MDALRDYYAALINAWGPQDWWPARSRFEVIAGAFLTQNTAWTNVEHALRNLRRARLLNLDGIRHVPRARLEKLVRPAGYFRQKALRLKTFVRWLDQRYAGSLHRMFARPTAELREELLALDGVGPETADSILLYAGGHPVFVVDAYTRRVLARHGLLPETAPYEEIRARFETSLAKFTPPDAALVTFPGERRRHKFVVRRAAPAARIYDEYHALLVQTAKRHCAKPAPRCEGCPLQPFLPRPS